MAAISAHDGIARGHTTSDGDSGSGGEQQKMVLHPRKRKNESRPNVGSNYETKKEKVQSTIFEVWCTKVPLNFPKMAKCESFGKS